MILRIHYIVVVLLFKSMVNYFIDNAKIVLKVDQGIGVMWRYIYFSLAFTNPLVIYIFSISSAWFSSYAGFFEENGLYYISLALYLPFAILLHLVWFGLQYGLVRLCKAVSIDVYFRTKFWAAALLAHLWGLYFLYSLSIGVPLADISSYWLAGSFWCIVVMVVFMYQFRVAVVKNELSAA